MSRVALAVDPLRERFPTPRPRRPTMEQTDTSLLARVRDPRDAAGWDTFVRLYSPLLGSYARRRGVPESQVDDVVQEILVKLLKALPNFRLDRSKGRFRTWLYRVTLSVIADRVQKSAAIDRAEDGWRQVHAADADGPEPDDWKEEYERRLLRFALETVRGRTSVRTWACFEGHLLKGRPASQVAEALKVSENAVYINSCRVMDRLRVFCKTYLEGLADDDPPTLPPGA